MFYSISNNCLLGQSWVGTYKWTTKCSQDECCCFANQLAITQVSDNRLSLVSDRAGTTCTKTKYENIVDNPERGSFMDTTAGPRTLIWVISPNGTAISAVDYQMMQCTSEAIKVNSSTNNNSYNVYLILIVNIITIIKWFPIQEQNI